MPSATDRARIGQWTLVLGLTLAGLSPGCANSRPTRWWRSRHGDGTTVGSRGEQGRDRYADSLGVRPQAMLAGIRPSRPREAPADGSVAWSEPPDSAMIAAEPRPGAANPTPATTLAASRTPPPVNEPAPSAEPAPASTSALAAARADKSLRTIERLVARGQETMARVASYQVAMNRQERVGEQLQPAENVVLSIRHEPRAVRLEWPDGPHKGREVIYSAAADGGGMMHIHMGDSMIPVPDMKMAPDNPMVMRSSRHPITEAGFEPILEVLAASLKPHLDGTAGADQMKYEGTETLSQTGQTVHKITRITPRGETWRIELDDETGLPLLVEEKAADGSLLEHYVFRNIKTDVPALASADAFDPQKRWGSKAGSLLGGFGRLARSGGSTAPTDDGSTTR